MKNLIILFLLVANYGVAQYENTFLEKLLNGDELKPENYLESYHHYDFSGIWTETKNYLIYGIIGADNQRIRVKLITVEKDSINPNEYVVTGKSNVKGNICDFNGIIKLTEIKEVKKLHYGVDSEYVDKGIQMEGILIGEYYFKENPKQEHSGIFSGKLFSKWYTLNTDQSIKYDDIQSSSDGYMNNAFIGRWQNYNSGKELICNWADYRVPDAPKDFDIGAGEFSPNDKYRNFGWEDYIEAQSHDNPKAKSAEMKEWWK